MTVRLGITVNQVQAKQDPQMESLEIYVLMARSAQGEVVHRKTVQWEPF